MTAQPTTATVTACPCGGTCGGTCDCCKGVTAYTPVTLANRPGLEELAYRIGTHGSFLASMLARIATHELRDPGPAAPRRPLAALKARTPDDPAIAMLDAWALVGDVLTFYQERIANEGFLRTANERRSLLELARLVGYRPRPGVSATAWLAYLVDKDFTGAETIVTIPKGSKAGSVPGPGETPQTFETDEAFEARSFWNTLIPKLAQPAAIWLDSRADVPELHFAGVSTRLNPNDRVVLGFDHGARVLIAATVTADQSANPSLAPGLVANQTVVTFQPGPSPLARFAHEKAQLIAALDVFVAEHDGPFLDNVKTAVIAPALPHLRTNQNGAPLFDLLDQVTAALGEWRLVATARRYTKVVGTLDTMIAQFESLAGFREVLPHIPAREAAVASLDDLIDSLRVPPSLPPAHRREMTRDAAQLYAPRSDLLTRVLAASDPALSGTLSQAIAHTIATAPAALEEVLALRIAAPPFGATAPLRPVTNASGVVVGSEEWPLAPCSVTFQGQDVHFSDSEGIVHLGIDSDDEHVSLDIDLAALPVQETLSDTISVDASLEEEGLRVDLAIGPLARRYILNAGDGFDYTIDDTSHLVLWGRSQRYRLAGRQIAVDTVEDDNGAQLFSLNDFGPGPVQHRNIVALDAIYAQVVAGSRVVIERSPTAAAAFAANDAAQTATGVFTVLDARTVAKAAYGLTGRVTELRLDNDWLTDADTMLSDIRDTTVYAQSEALELAGEPIADDIGGGTIELDRLYSGLDPGRWLIVRGERTDLPGTAGIEGAELVMLAGIAQTAPQDLLPGTAITSVLHLATDLAYTYRRDTVTIFGNVVKATHGETIQEIIGSGAATRTFQEFPLSQAPLTNLPSPSPLGAASTLEVFVDRVQWREAEAMPDLGPRDRGFVTRTADDDTTTVIGGNGITGARLPTGTANVEARYRFGTGKPGNVAANQISQLLSRPLGVNSVINPIATSGGAGRDEVAQIRRNAPLGMLAIDRLVSVRDYEDFTRVRAGIGKASATLLSDGTRTLVHLTIAGNDDVPIAETSDLYRNLRQALADNGDPAIPVAVAVRELSLLIVSAGVRVQPDYRWETVEPAIRAALLDRFGFGRRELGQDATASEMLTAIQRVPGVRYADLDIFAQVPETTTPAALSQIAATFTGLPPARLPSHLARYTVTLADVRIDPATGVAETLPAFAGRVGIPVTRLLELNPAIVSVTLTAGMSLTIYRGVRPAQLLLLTPDIPDTLILRELPS